MKRISSYFSNRFLPRWLVLLFDLSIIPVSWFLACILRYNFDLSQALNSMHIFHLGIMLPVFLFFFWKLRSYSGIIRHSTTTDITRVSIAMSGSGLLIALLIFLARQYSVPFFENMSYSVIIITVFASTGGMVLARLTAKYIFLRLEWNNIQTKNVMIYGAGQLGQITSNALKNDANNIKVIGFIDDNISLRNKYVSGIPVYAPERAFFEIIPKNNVTEVIFAINQPNISPKRKREITDLCLERKIDIKEVPPVNNWINGILQTKTIRRVNIEDLLGRDAISLNHEKIEAGLRKSVVLVTGAAGSIGSEIVRQLIGFHVKQVILLDKAESDLYDLQNEILGTKGEARFEVVVGDVTNKKMLRKVFEYYSPSIVFNAAAYKHVPLMEDFPHEAIRVNVGGTKTLADVSMEFGVEKFVFVSTDKAVNPTNVMGATKRASEIYIQSLSQATKSSTRFITTRFGNVLGSNGSVIPLFKKQIEKGGPLTVTHKDIERFFMTIPEACQLVLEAGFMGKGGEIYVFDMGEPVKIYDLAHKMISLSGLTPGRDIEIKITGLRPGEKLYEELLDNKETLLETYNSKIMIGKTRHHNHQEVNWQITGLLHDLDEKSNEQLVEELKYIVPDFSSVNPNYAQEPIKKAKQMKNSPSESKFEFPLFPGRIGFIPGNGM